jgi:cellulose synthase operon protein YhjQ
MSSAGDEGSKMADRGAFTGSHERPEDVAALYSWANLQSAKYRDASASRAQTRENARQRVEESIEIERRRTREEAEAQRNSESNGAVEIQRQGVMQARPRAEQESAQGGAPLQPNSQQRAWVPGPQPSASAFPQGTAAPKSNPQPGAPYSAAAPSFPSAPPLPGSAAHAVSAPAAHPVPAASTAAPDSVGAQPNSPGAPVRDERSAPNRAWGGVEPKESIARPAWLAANRSELAVAPLPPAPEDTLQGSRDRITSRWFALKGLFTDAPATTAEPSAAPVISRAPVLAVFSLAGGVGKTSLVATLGRALSARGERVLLVDTAAYGLLPFFFGARDQRPGVLRTFTAPGQSGDAPVQLLTIDCENLGPESGSQEVLTQEIARNCNGVGRILVDLATASGAITRRVLRMNPTVLVPVTADMTSVVSFSSIDSFFQRNSAGSGQPVLPFYVLNQFDPSLPLHLDVREVLREQLGDRLLPFSLRRAPAVSEALAEGMTVVDYAPNSTVSEDYVALAGWVKSLSAPASSGFRGVRWSER